MTVQESLFTISELSREFGNDDYVCGGGGNTSVKDSATLWIKPSGVGLKDMRPENFLPLGRETLNRLYETSFPAGANEREAAVMRFMTGTILPGNQGRPSVEAPLHNLFPQRFVVHTHPPLVNGMTCGAKSAEAVRELFPDALHVRFVEPGYTLCMAVRKEMEAYRQKRGRFPDMLFQDNHGVFIAHDEADGVRELYRQAVAKIGAKAKAAGFDGPPERGPLPSGAATAKIAALLREVMGADAAEVAAGGPFKVPAGPLTPDHIVYCRSWMYEGTPDRQGLESYRAKRGYWPKVVSTPEGVFGVGAGAKAAGLALDMAWDGAKVVRHAGAFGGVRYLERKFVDFIENWEVESYRQKQV